MAVLTVIALVNFNLHTDCDFTEVSPWHCRLCFVVYWLERYNGGSERFELLSFKLLLCLHLSVSTSVCVATHSQEQDVHGNLFCKDF